MYWWSVSFLGDAGGAVPFHGFTKIKLLRLECFEMGQRLNDQRLKVSKTSYRVGPRWHFWTSKVVTETKYSGLVMDVSLVKSGPMAGADMAEALPTE